ncbi:MAG: hypothetical protein IAF94_25320 [Pirellulaceae bacterium]|nr:hypothetical protein [Pirellulaceae bacterium]
MPLRSTYFAIVFVAVLTPVLTAQESVPLPKRGVPAAKGSPRITAIEESEEPVVVGNMEHQGWVLSGPRGRHYFFGGLAVADYVAQGERRIVTLQQEEPTLLPNPDPHFLYYRELQSRHRWAVAREPLADGKYVIFHQRKGSDPSSDPKKAWQEFQRANLEWKKNEVAWKSR